MSCKTIKQKMINIKMKFNVIKYNILKWISKHTAIAMVFSCGVLIAIFSFCFGQWQRNLNSLVVEILGAMLIIIVVEIFIMRISKLSMYPDTKQYIYGNFTGVLRNLVLNMFRILPIHGVEQDSINNLLTFLLTDKNTQVPGLEKHETQDLKTQGIEILKMYCKEENRELIERIYCQLTDSELSIWVQCIEEYQYKIELFIDNTLLISAKDEDVVEALKIHLRLQMIKSELKKSRETRKKNKGFFSSYIFHIAQSLVNTIESGLYSHWAIPKHIRTVMERSEV